MGSNAVMTQAHAAARPSLSRLTPLLIIVLFAAALWIVHREIAHLHWEDIGRAFARLTWREIAGAFGLTAASYLLLTFNEAMGLRYAGQALPYRIVAVISFVSYAFAHNIGLALVTGGSVRYRLYSAQGLSALNVAAVTGFCGLTFPLGLLAAGGLAMLVDPAQALAVLAAPRVLVLAAGVLALGLCLAYVIATVVLKRPLRIGDWSLRVPPPWLALGQVGIGAVDLIATAAVTYLLIPDQAPVTFAAFTAAYMLATLAGAVSHLPGGIGVFEAGMLLLLPNIQQSDLLAALLAYRFVYYILPLFLAAGLWVGRETVAGHAALGRAGSFVRSAAPAVGAPLVGLATFIGGSILLLSGATPALPDRIDALKNIVPLPFIEASHLLASVSGFMLLVLARGLFRRLSGAYYMTVTVLAAGAAFSLLKGFDYEEALVCSAILAILVASRSAFYRGSAMLAQPLTLNWLVSIAVVVAGAMWLGFFEYRDVVYSHELWTTLAVDADAPRFLRASLAIALVAVVFGVLALMGPPKAKSAPPSVAELERVRAIVAASPDTNAHLALLGDKAFFFSRSGRSFIMYGVRGRSWVALGNPVGPREEWKELLWDFRSLVDRYGGRIAFYQVDAEHLPLYLDLGLAVYKLGEEAILPIEGLTLQGNARKEWRAAKNKGEREGLSFELLQPNQIAAAMAELLAVSEGWLQSRATREKGFSVGFFDPAYLASGPVAIARQSGRIIAFANLLEGAERQELSVDLMRHLPDVPRGTMDYLFVELLLWGATAGFRSFNFGMAPFSGLTNDRLAPLWNKIGNLIFVHGNRYYNFMGLRRYKDKFHPRWRPKFLAAPNGLAVPTLLVDVAALVSGGAK